MTNFKFTRKENLQDRVKGFPFEEDPTIWETQFVFLTRDRAIHAGCLSLSKELGIYFQPKAGRHPVILLEEIEEIWEVEFP